MINLWEEIKALVEHKVVFLDKQRTKYAQINENGKIVNEKRQNMFIFHHFEQ